MRSRKRATDADDFVDPGPSTSKTRAPCEQLSSAFSSWSPAPASIRTTTERPMPRLLIGSRFYSNRS